MAFLNRTFAAATIAAAGLVSPPMTAPAWAQDSQPANVSAANDSTNERTRELVERLLRGSDDRRPMRERLATAPSASPANNNAPSSASAPAAFNNAAPAPRTEARRNADRIAPAELGSLSLAELVTADEAKGYYYLRTASTPSAAALEAEIARYGTHAIVVLNGVNRGPGGPGGFVDEDNQIQSDLLITLGPRWADKSDAPVILIEYQAATPSAEIFAGGASVGTVSYPQALAAVPAHVTGDARWNTAMRNMHETVTGWVADANTQFAATPEAARNTYASAAAGVQPLNRANIRNISLPAQSPAIPSTPFAVVERPQMTPEQRAEAQRAASNIPPALPGTESLGYLVKSDERAGFYLIRIDADPEGRDNVGTVLANGDIQTIIDKQVAMYGNNAIVITNFIPTELNPAVSPPDFFTYTGRAQQNLFDRQIAEWAGRVETPIVLLEIVSTVHSKGNLETFVYGNSHLYALERNRLGQTGAHVDVPHDLGLLMPFANIYANGEVIITSSYMYEFAHRAKFDDNEVTQHNNAMRLANGRVISGLETAQTRLAALDRDDSQPIASATGKKLATSGAMAKVDQPGPGLP